MPKVFALAISTFKEALRNKVMYGAVFFAVALVAAGALFGNVSVGEQSLVVKDFGLFALSYSGAIIVMLSGVSLVSRELGRKTIYNILSKPVSRGQFIVGKFLGLCFASCFVVLSMSALFLATCFFYDEKIDLLMVQGVGLVLLETIVVCGLVIFFSSLVVTPALAGLFSLGVFLTGKSIAAVTRFIESDPELSYLQEIIIAIKYLVPQGHLFSANESLVYGVSMGGAYFLQTLTYALIYTLACVTGAAGLFYQRTLK